MKKIIPLLGAMLLLAGCGNNSTSSQANPMNSSSGEQSPNSAQANSSSASGQSVNSPSLGTITNAPAAAAKQTGTNSPVVQH